MWESWSRITWHSSVWCSAFSDEASKCGEGFGGLCSAFRRGSGAREEEVFARDDGDGSEDDGRQNHGGCCAAVAVELRGESGGQGVEGECTDRGDTGVAIVLASEPATQPPNGRDENGSGGHRDTEEDESAPCRVGEVIGYQPEGERHSECG